MTEQSASWAGKIGDAAVDAAGLGGAAFIIYGAHLVYHPAAFIVGGAFLLGGAWLAARRIED